ncbi:MAG TPA: putative Ig domain-containing protein [Opitutaceae bacterium]|nr:putative Ig domain-containing protein [Opitutaceae bacterium]
MKFSTRVFSLVATLIGLGGIALRADNMASIAITPATGVVTLTPRWGVGGSLAGFHHMAQDLGLGGTANNFYSIKSTAIPSGGDIAAFNLYVAASGAATPHADIGSKLTPSSYSALSSADPDVGYGSVNFYTIHHKGTTDYFSVIKPGSGVASAVTDLKPMSAPGGPATLTGVSGYFGLTFAATNLGYGLNSFYYLRTDPVTGFTKFGTLSPPLLSGSADQFDLGMGGHNALAFTGTDVGFGTDKMYYLRLDPVTGYTIFGTLHPVTGRASDVANLGSVYSTLTFVPGDLGFGTGRFYTTGSVNSTWQSISFAAIADRAISAGSFTVNPTASSALAIVLTVVPGSTGAASISASVGGVFTVTPTAPGVITLQATQAGQSAPTAFAGNMLRQSFTASGSTLLAITSQPTSQSAVAGSTATLSVVASGTTTVTYQWRKAGTNITGNASATTSTLSLPNSQAADSGSYDVVVTNASGSFPSNAVTLTVSAAPAGSPVITNSSLSAPATSGTPFSFTVAASGSPTSFTATGLPTGLSIAAATGVISGTPIASGTSNVIIGATNASGTGNATLTITVAASTNAPIITGAATAPASVGTAVNYQIAATGVPTAYTAAGLPAGLSLNPSTGAITGTPTAAGTSIVVLTATNAFGTGNSTLTITVAAANVAPIIVSPPTAGGSIGVPFTTYVIAATGQPTSYSATGLPAGLTLNSTTGAISGTATVPGTYGVTVTATNSFGSSTVPVTIVITSSPTAASSRITAFSARSQAGTGNQTLIMGFAVSGTKTLIVRGLGFALASLGVPNVLADPQLALYSGGSSIGANDDWGTNPNVAQLVTDSARAGLYPLAAGSKDSALIAVVNTGVYTSRVTGANNTTGTAMTEVYDADPNSTSSARLFAVSVRMQVEANDGILIGGLIITGNAAKTVLIRGIGPTLSTLGVTGVLADPQLAVFSKGAVIGSNDNWETGNNVASLTAAFLQLGEFPLPTGSKDAAMLITLQPGAYTVHLSGVANTTGVALIEVYDTE